MKSEEMFSLFKEITKAYNEGDLDKEDVLAQLYAITYKREFDYTIADTNSGTIPAQAMFINTLQEYFDWLYYCADGYLFDIERSHVLADYLITQCIPAGLAKSYNRLPKWYS